MSTGSVALRDVFTRRQFSCLALLFTLLAIYGSLVPLKYTPLSWDEAVARFRAIPFLQLGVEKRADWVANILLFLPLGFLGMAAACVDGPRRRAWLLAPFWILALAALSVAIEFTQIFFPPRTVSQNDIQAETLGGFLGTIIWLAAGQKLTRWFRKVWTGLGNYGQAALWLPGYFVFLVWIHVMPLDLTLSPVEVWRKWKNGQIILIPFTTPYETFHKAILKNLANFVYFLPVGLLLANLRHSFWQNRNNAGKVLFIGLAIAAGIEFLQVFVFTRYVDLTDLVTGTAAILTGWSLALWGQQLSVPASIRLCYAGMVVCLLLILYMNWEPFVLHTDAETIAVRWSKTTWIPFADYYWGAEYDAFDNLLRKSLPFFAAGICCAGAFRSRIAWLRKICVVLAALVSSIVVEGVQVLIPPHHPGITDVIVQTLAAWFGCVIGCRLPWAMIPHGEDWSVHESSD